MNKTYRLLAAMKAQHAREKNNGGAATPVIPEKLPRLFDATAAERKLMPIGDGVLGYFPDALAAMAYVSYVGNIQHNPGQPLHWAQDKSSDHVNCIGRHLAQLGTLDVDGVPHSWKLLWRAAANVQMEMQTLGAPVPRCARAGTAAHHETV